MPRKRALVGDTLQITTAKGYAYAQFTHRNKLLGCLIRVLPGFSPTPLDPKALAAKVQGDTLYHTFLFEDCLHEKPTIQIIARLPIPEHARSFPLFKAGLRDPKTNKVETWWLWDGEKEWRIGPLPDHQKSLPVREIWTYKILVNRLEIGWLPEHEQ